jgi:2'-5' RNA ligase
MRAFVAIEMTEPIREALAALLVELRRVDAPVKWVEPQNIHLTLKFLGEVPDESVPKAGEILRQCVAGVAPFALEVKGAGGFPNLKRPRVIFVGALDQPPTSAGLAGRLNEQMAALGVEREDRAFQNHITLGRVRESRPKSARRTAHDM